MGQPTVLDLFCGAAGGWSLGLHRAGYRTVAACELIDWRRVLFLQNNPNVVIYDDVCTLTADRLIRDLGFLPDVIAGSPPCQDVSSANTKGKGVDGERSGLFFEAIRIARECRAIDPNSARWIALENSSNLRTRGADRVISTLAAVGYTSWPFVVGADDAGANHERKRSWIVGCDPAQIANANGQRRDAGWQRRGSGLDIPVPHDLGDVQEVGCGERRPGRCAVAIEGLSVETCRDADAAGFGHESGRSRRHGPDGNSEASAPSSAGNAAHADQAGQADGCMVASLRQAEIANNGCGDERSDDVSDANGDGKSDGAVHDEMGGCSSFGGATLEPWADWNGGLAGHLRMDDGLSAWVAGTRIEIGGPRGTVAASLIVEAFGDAVLPQITESIGRSILRVEAAMAALVGEAA